MKAVFFYILFVCFGLLGAHNYAHATAHNGKLSFAATHNTVHKQQPDANNFIDVEDENDDKDIARRFPQQAKWISTIIVRPVVHNFPTNNFPDGSLPDITGAQICIEHRVLRI